MKKFLDKAKLLIIITIMKTFDQIIQDKKNGIDCTEYESAFVKQVIKNLEKYFPNEFDEAVEEMRGEMLFS